MSCQAFRWLTIWTTFLVASQHRWFSEHPPANPKLCQDSGTGECEGKTKRNSNKFYCPSDDADDDAMVELGIGGEHSIISAGRSSRCYGRFMFRGRGR